MCIYMYICVEICTFCSIKIISVNVAQKSSLEACARNARYDVFSQILAKNEVLLLAHHLQDQAETVLLRLFRGAGICGLSAIKKRRKLGQGLLVRPLLDISPQDLKCYANLHNLTWIEDPSNFDSKFARNYIRYQILPKLQQNWSNLNLILARTAQHALDAQDLLDELAIQDLAQIQNFNFDDELAWLNLPNLDALKLQKLSFNRQKNVVRYFLKSLTLLPDTKHWHGFNCLLSAQNDGNPVWQLASGKLIRANHKIWWLSNNWNNFEQQNYDWQNLSKPLELGQNGQVQIVGKLDIDAKKWQIRYRTSSEIIFHPKFGGIKLKRYLNQAKIPYFVRQRLPLLYADEQLIAVANIRNYWHNWHLNWQIPQI